MSRRMGDTLFGLAGAQLAFGVLRALGIVRWAWYITLSPLAIGELAAVCWLLWKIRKE